MTSENQLKSKLSAGQSVFGTWSMLPSPGVISVIGHSGVDFVIIDLEHGPASLETVEYQLYAADAAGITPIIRLAEAHEPTILRALETGAQSLLVSQVRDAETAARVVSATKYPPDGTRGLSPFTRHHGYTEQDLPASLQAANKESFVGVLVEGEEGLANLDEIAATPGLDMVYLGVYDLSQVIGAPGQLDHPEVIKAVHECAGAIERQGVIAGSVARDREYLKLLIDANFRFLSYRVDSAILRDGLETACNWYKQLI